MLGDCIEAVRTRLGVAADIWLTGAHNLGSSGAPPRYVWVPRQDSIQGAGLSSSFAARLPRPLLTRVAGVECHVWGATLAATETMAHAVVAAAHELWKGEISFNGIAWPEEAWSDSGIVAVVRIGFHIPITAVALESLQAAQATIIECDDTPPVTPDRYIECCEEIDP